MFRKISAFVIGACAALTISANASAETVTTELLTYKVYAISVTYNGNTFYAGGGAFEWVVHSDDLSQLPYGVGEHFISFCIEATEGLSANVPYEYNVVDPANAPNVGWTQMGSEKADMLARWFGAYYQGNSLDDWDPIEAMAFQMGIWEIIAEDENNPLDLVSGKLQINNQTNARAIAQNWLDDPAWKEADAKRLSLIALTSPLTEPMTYIQDQILVVPTAVPSVVPLPAPLLAGGLLLGGVGLKRWRSSR